MKKPIYLAIIPIFFFVTASISQARVNSISGGLNVGFDVDHYNYKTDNNASSSTTSNQDHKTLSVSPSISWKSEDVKDSIEVKYGLGLNFGLDGKGNDVDHNLNLSGQRSLTQNWRIRISDLYIKTNDASSTASTNLSSGYSSSATTNNTTGTDSSTTSPSSPGSNSSSNITLPARDTNLNSSVDTGSSDQISGQLGRHRFWTNYASLSTDYTYWKDSVVSLGYRYTILRNENSGSGGYQDYDKHSGVFSASYQFNPEWKTVVGGEYVRGLYGAQQTSSLGTQSDLTEYHGSARLQTSVIHHNPLALAYQYSGTRYDNTNLNDSDIHQANIDWQHLFSSQMSFAVGGGPSYIMNQGRSSIWGYNAHFNFNYTFERGGFNIGVQKTYGQQNFTGTSTGGTINSWSVSSKFGYQLFQYLSYGLTASYADQNHENPIASDSGTTTVGYNEKVYNAGASMDYKFWRWYSLSFGYSFTRQKSASGLALNYDEHRVFITLGVQKEFWRW